MFAKAKRFDSLSLQNKQNNSKQLKLANETPLKNIPLTTGIKNPILSCVALQCDSVKSTKSLVTPKPVKTITTKTPSTLKKPPSCKIKTEVNTQHELIKAQEVEIKNKDYTILEYTKQIEEYQTKIQNLTNQVEKTSKNNNKLQHLQNKLSKISLLDNKENVDHDAEKKLKENLFHTKIVSELQTKISELEKQCKKLEDEIYMKQSDISSLDKVITVRDSLCKDLQEKLTIVESKLNETHQRLDMVNGHHALALEANESIRKEYKTELETTKFKFDEEKQTLINKCKKDQENIKSECNALIDVIKSQINKKKCEEVQKLKQQLAAKDLEMKAKLELLNEATHEKLRLCEIQFEERCQSIQEHYSKQQKNLQYLEKEVKDLKYNLSETEDQNNALSKEISEFKNINEVLTIEKLNMTKEIVDLKEELKNKLTDFETEINKLMGEVDKATKEKNKFETSLAVTREIVQVLSVRLRESDNEIENLEEKFQSLIKSKEILENELSNYKSSLNTTVAECNEYKEALVSMLHSKAALDKEHTHIMEHNVSLMECLQNVEKEAYRELSSIKNELIEDVELLRQESNSQIKHLLEEVEKKRMLCELAKKHAEEATAATEHSRLLLSQASSEITRLELENQCFQRQIEDQQSLVVELSLLRQENEELTMTVAKQSSLTDKMKKEIEQLQYKPKSPSVLRKTHVSGKENLTTALSPLRERNY